MNIPKKYIVDEQGVPKEVIIPFETFREIEEMLGLDFDETTMEQLRDARRDREKGTMEAYCDLDDLG